MYNIIVHFDRTVIPNTHILQHTFPVHNTYVDTESMKIFYLRLRRRRDVRP